MARKDKFDKPTYADMLILKGLKLERAAAKTKFVRKVGKGLEEARKKIMGVRLRRKKKKAPEKSYTTARTKTIEKSVGDVTETKQWKRLRRKK